MVITLVIYLSGSLVLFLCVDCNTAFAGLAYMFINVRVALGIAHQGVPTEPSGMDFASGPLTQQETILDLELGDTVADGGKDVGTLPLGPRGSVHMYFATHPATSSGTVA